MIQYVYRFALALTKEQIIFLNQQIGSCRFTYNKLLEKAKKEKNFNYYEYKKCLVQFKQENLWLKETNSQSLQATCMNLKRAFVNFFEKRALYPQFKRKGKKDSIGIPQHFKIENDLLFLPKLKSPIKMILHRSIEGVIKSISITKESSGKFFVNVSVEKEISPLPMKKAAIALDLGLKTLAFESDGEKLANLRLYRRAEKKLRKYQRQMAKKEKKSQNRRKAVLKVAKSHEKVRNQRLDFLHKASFKIVRDNQTIILEDLSIKNMVKNKKLSKSILDASWSEFKRQIKYKAAWHGREIIEIKKNYPSSKTCSICGYKKTDLTLQDREWSCPECQTFHDRDYNSALGLLKIGLEQSQLTPVDYALAAEQKYLFWSTSYHRNKQEACHLNGG